jgi:hypothetical protein
VSAVLSPATTPPALPGIRRMIVVGAIALIMVVLAIAASLFELRHDRDVRHQYENSLMVTHLAFDAESLASRLRTWQDLSVSPAAPGPAGTVPGGTGPAAGSGPNPALRESLRSVDIDLAEWKRRVTDAMQREFSPETKQQLTHLSDSVTSMRQALRWPSEILDATQSGAGEPASPGSNAHEDADRAYLGAVEAAQATLLASGRSGGEKILIGRYTESEISAAVVVGASMAALLMGAVLAEHAAPRAAREPGGDRRHGRAAAHGPVDGHHQPPRPGREPAGGDGARQARLDAAHRSHARPGLLQALQQSARTRRRRLAAARRLPGLAPATAADRHAGALRGRGIHPGTAQLRRRAGRSADRPPAAPDARQPDFSAGIATWDFSESGEQLLRRADESLLSAKKQGRNRTVVSGQEEQIALVLPPVAG